MTLIGTSTNIIVSDLATTAGLAPIGMFELARASGPVVLLGGILLFLLSNRLLPRTHTPIPHTGRSERHRYIAELAIPAESPHVGREVRAPLQADHPAIEVHEVLRGERVRYPETGVWPVPAWSRTMTSMCSASSADESTTPNGAWWDSGCR